MTVFGDTSAFYSLLVATERTHPPIRAVFEKLLDSGRPLWTTSMVMMETMALLQKRIGLAAARDFDEHVLPIVRVKSVDDALLRSAVDRLWRENRPSLSLVDCVSFEFMKAEGITTAFAADPVFSEAGFRLLA